MNNKGYMIVEIIVASVLAMTIAYFLFDLVIKLKEKIFIMFMQSVLLRKARHILYSLPRKSLRLSMPLTKRQR